MFNVEFDTNLKQWFFDFHGDWIVLDAKNKHDAIDEMDIFLMENGTDIDNGMEN
jgi:hypothetical protein